MKSLEMKVASIDKGVFNVLPDAICQVIQFAGCTNKCPECHSQYLWKNVGFTMDSEWIVNSLISVEDIPDVVIYGEPDSNESCVSWEAFKNLLQHLQEAGYKVSVWSGRNNIPPQLVENFEYLESIKIGRYKAKLGGLESGKTNQRFYQLKKNTELVDATKLFRKKGRVKK